MSVLSKNIEELERVPIYPPQKVKEITKTATDIRILTEFCKGCELCVSFCPEEILKMDTALNTKSYHYPYVIEEKNEKCSQCRMCERICPELAIFLLENHRDQDQDPS